MEQAFPVRPGPAGDGGDVRGPGDGAARPHRPVDLAGAAAGGGGGEGGEGEEDLVRREDGPGDPSDPRPGTRG